MLLMVEGISHMISHLISLFVNVIASLFGKNKLSILTYHRVGSSGNAIAMNEALFEQQLLWIKRYFNPIDLTEGLALQKAGKLPPRSVAITIDDGYADSFNTIFPLLKKHQLTATFFISTAGLQDQYLWDELVAFTVINTPKRAISFNNKHYSLISIEERHHCMKSCLEEIKYCSVKKRNELIKTLLNETELTSLNNQFLTKEQVVILSDSGMGIGAHTHNHPILMSESERDAQQEIQKSKSIIEGILGKDVHYFAYPNGRYQQDFDDTHIAMVKEAGFSAAFSTDWGLLSHFNLDRFQIKRFTPWHETESRFVLSLALNYCK